MRCDKRFGVRFWPFLQQSCTKVQELPINLYKLYQTARISWWRSQISKILSHHWLLLWMVFREFASHASVADRVASRVASQKSFCESRLSHTNSLTRLVWNKWVTREVLQNENAYKLSLYIMKCGTSHELSQLWTRNLQGTRNELS